MNTDAVWFELVGTGKDKKERTLVKTDSKLDMMLAIKKVDISELTELHVLRVRKVTHEVDFEPEFQWITAERMMNGN